MTPYAALVFALAAIAVGAFQLALILGAPWGEFTLGGRWHGPLPTKVRLLPLLSLILLGSFAAVILARAQLALLFLEELSRSLVWGVVGYCMLGCVAHVITPSKCERRLWLPVILLMLVSSLIVALS